MKQIFLTSLAVCCIVFAASAGSHFKTIHFTSYWNETQKSGLDMQFGSSPTQGMSQRAEGDIIINTEDSTFRITADGAAPQIYKLTKIEEETDNKRASYQEVVLNVKDKNGVPFRVTLQRHYDLRFVKVFVFPENSDTYLVYGCDYLKKLK